MCDLFSLIPTLETDETLRPLCDTALTFLWNCVASTVSLYSARSCHNVLLTIQDSSVVEASFRTLCHFELDYFKLIYLPNKVNLLIKHNNTDSVLSSTVWPILVKSCHVLVVVIPVGLRRYSNTRLSGGCFSAQWPTMCPVNSWNQSQWTSWLLGLSGPCISH